MFADAGGFAFAPGLPGPFVVPPSRFNITVSNGDMILVGVVLDWRFSAAVSDDAGSVYVPVGPAFNFSGSGCSTGTFMRLFASYRAVFRSDASEGCIVRDSCRPNGSVLCDLHNGLKEHAL